jgi:DNA-binding NarL/FixJ family response regulator
VVLLTTHDLPELAQEGVRAGAIGFVLKPATAPIPWFWPGSTKTICKTLVMSVISS